MLCQYMLILGSGDECMLVLGPLTLGSGDEYMVLVLGSGDGYFDALKLY